jgi:hypothetical protein
MKSVKNIVLISFLGILILALYSCKETTIKGWYKAGNKPESYRVGLDKSIYQNGNQSAFLESIETITSGFGTLMQSCETKNYSGKKIKMSGFIKSENVKDWAGMWLRIDESNKPSTEHFDNMVNRPIKGSTDWTNYEIIMDVPVNSYTMNFGILLSGTGKVWIDNVKFEIIDDSSEKFEEPYGNKKSTGLNLQPDNLDFEK